MEIVEEPEHYYPIKPEDYDFPCSSSFRAWTYQHCGVQDPGYIPPEPVIEPEPLREIIHRHSDLSRQEFAELRQLRFKCDYLEEQLKELSKPKKKPETRYGYKGVR